MKQMTLFDYLPKIEKVELENRKYEKGFKGQEITTNSILKQYKSLIKSLIQQDLTEVIIEKKNFENLSNLLGDHWFYDEESFGYTDKKHIMSISTIQQFNISFFKIYKRADFELIKNFQMDIADLTEEEYTMISDTEYNTIYFRISLEILGELVQMYQHKKLKLLYLMGNKSILSLLV